MILRCKNCKERFSILENEDEIVGNLVHCKHCHQEWIYESKTKYLENRLAELSEDLDKTEVMLNLKKNEHREKISNLENNLKIKKKELDDQNKLEQIVLDFEKRLTNTEKTNSEQIDLEIKIANKEKEIESMYEDIYSKNMDIEKKTNYIESKIKSYNYEKNLKTNIQNEKIKVNNSEVVNLRSFEKVNKTNKDQVTDNKKKSKFRFFSPDQLK